MGGGSLELLAIRGTRCGMAPDLGSFSRRCRLSAREEAHRLIDEMPEVLVAERVISYLEFLQQRYSKPLPPVIFGQLPINSGLVP